MAFASQRSSGFLQSSQERLTVGGVGENVHIQYNIIYILYTHLVLSLRTPNVYRNPLGKFVFFCQSNLVDFTRFDMTL